MKEIRPIETRYKGYRFRSRLEARWAVFFEDLGLTWEYEPQGFELATGRYLPDFFLPDIGCWVEVKPDPDSYDWKRINELAQATGRDVICLTGTPAVAWYAHFMCGFEFEDADGSIQKVPAAMEYIDLAASEMLGRPATRPGPDDPGPEALNSNSLPAFRHAVNAARSARFEFGETPGGGGV